MILEEWDFQTRKSNSYWLVELEYVAIIFSKFYELCHTI